MQGWPLLVRQITLSLSDLAAPFAQRLDDPGALL